MKVTQKANKSSLRFLSVLLPLLLLASVARAQDRFASLYDPCGGINLCGSDTQCYSCVESDCIRSGEYYWQCRDDQIEGISESNDGGGSDGDTEPVPAAPTTPNLEELWRSYPPVADYEACGGLTEHACGLDAACALCASTNYICLRTNPWYYQCVEDPTNAGNQDGDGSNSGGGDSGNQDSTIPANEEEEEEGEGEDNSNDQSSNSNDGNDADADTDDSLPLGEETYPLVEDYGPCGGISRHPCGSDAACAGCVSDTFICARGNEWYWQCVEDTTGGGGSNNQNDSSNSPEDENSTEDDTTDAGNENDQTQVNPGEEANNDAGAVPNQPPTESGTAATTTFFDGCKPSCAWRGNIMQELQMGPVYTCANTFDENGQQLINDQSNPDLKNVCGGGGSDPTEPNGSVAYSCVSRQPWTDSSTGQKYAFAARNSLDSCCKCYKLTFLDVSIGGDGNACSPDCSKYRGELQGESLVIQVINTGADVASAQFDIMIPGFGFGIFNGVTEGQNGPGLFDGSDPALWGQRYGGLDEEGIEACNLLPQPVREGCRWQFSEFLNSDNPGVSYERVSCALHPELVDKSGCLLLEDTVS